MMTTMNRRNNRSFTMTHAGSAMGSFSQSCAGAMNTSSMNIALILDAAILAASIFVVLVIRIIIGIPS